MMNLIKRLINILKVGTSFRRKARALEAQAEQHREATITSMKEIQLSVGYDRSAFLQWKADRLPLTVKEKMELCGRWT
jgi:hypothetical protein